ncbi:hypothetical protein CAL18_14740 [Bordetella genomosp. 7]|uniref:ABC transporter ATP-binding protein n=1 Tax=Bordetella genomosp. 7 TaxID=1416805 RepID=UPI000B9E341E|nr:ABC transporter ATP-binding protein [Bordetella genomosp. 7]OZI17386.1 hypothetical protein CAL18_14740 [Bordetella genomosp. 7]
MDGNLTARANGVAAPEVLLRFSEVSKTYRTAQDVDAVALRPVTASLNKGEFVSLLGPSGCGKTTLLKMAAGLVRPTSGSITLADGAPLQPGCYGFVFQAAALLPWRTAIQNVLLPAEVLGLPRAAASRRAAELLEKVGLASATHKRPAELSGGMQQRVSIARALLHDPALMFMDEPFGALDAMTREELNLELQRIHLNFGKTVLFVTHDIEEAVLLSDRIFVMSAGPGRMLREISVQLDRPRSLETKRDPAFHHLVSDIRELLHGAARAAS